MDIYNIPNLKPIVAQYQYLITSISGDYGYYRNIGSSVANIEFH